MIVKANISNYVQTGLFDVAWGNEQLGYGLKRCAVQVKKQ